MQNSITNNNFIDTLINLPVKTRRLILFIYTFIIIFLAIFPLYQVGATELDQLFVITIRADHFLHILAFIPAYPLMLWAFNPDSIFKKTLLLLAASVLAFFSEYIQFYLAYRSYNTADILANLLGVIIGMLIVTAFVLIKWRNTDPETV